MCIRDRIGTAGCFGDYFRLKGPRVARAVAELAEAEVLAPVRVRGWDRPVFLHRDATVPRLVSGRALLSPFDPLVFERRRLEELFGCLLYTSDAADEEDS